MNYSKGFRLLLCCPHSFALAGSPLFTSTSTRFPRESTTQSFTVFACFLRLRIGTWTEVLPGGWKKHLLGGKNTSTRPSGLVLQPPAEGLPRNLAWTLPCAGRATPICEHHDTRGSNDEAIQSPVQPLHSSKRAIRSPPSLVNGQVHVEHGVGHGGYDCNAGASNWMQGALDPVGCRGGSTNG